MKRGQILAILGAVVLTIVLYLAARTPKESAVKASEETVETPVAEVNELDAKVEEAVQIIQSGSGAPMQAVALLREVIAVDSNHISANFWLGEFSMMSGQFDKAIIRFNKLHNLQPDNAEYCIKLARAHGSAGQPEQGVEVLNAFLSTHPDDKTKEQVAPVLEELSVKL